MTFENRKVHTWTEQDSSTFLDLGRYYVPDRERQIATIVALIPSQADPFHIVELGCGEGLLTEAMLKRFINATVHAYDGSATMRDHVRSRLAGFGERLQVYDFDLTARAWRTPPFQVHGIVSSLCIHHLDAREKQILFHDVCQMLLPGGVFVLADLVQPQTPLAVELAAQAWEESVRQRALEFDGNTQALEQFRADHWNHFRHPDPADRPSPLFHQLQWLQDAGFSDVDVYWMLAGHAIFGGRKQAHTSARSA